MKKESALAKACAKAGDLLFYDAPRKRDLPAWIAHQFEQLGTTVERDATRLLIEMVGDRLDTDVAGAGALGMTTVQALWFRADDTRGGEPDFMAFTPMDVLNAARRLAL